MKTITKLAASQIEGTVNSDITVISSTNLGGSRAIAINENGLGIYADNTSNGNKYIGISVHAANGGTEQIIRIQGKLQDVSWNWDISKPIFLGNNGLIVQEEPTTGWSLQIGSVLNNNTIIINKGILINREV